MAARSETDRQSHADAVLRIDVLVQDKIVDSETNPKKVGWAKRNWVDNADGSLAPAKLVLILRRAALLAGDPPAFESMGTLTEALASIADKNDPRLQTRGGPARRGGGGRSYNRQTFENVLELKNHPTRETLRVVCGLMVELLSDRFAEMGRVGEPLREVLSRRFDYPSDCLAAVLGSLSSEFTREARPSPKSYVSPVFSVTHSVVSAGDLWAKVDRALDVLRTPDGERVVQFSGPEQSGKFTAIQMLLTRLDRLQLKTRGGWRLPVLALAIDELAPFEFVERVHAFYRSAEGTRSIAPNMPWAARLEEIKALAIQFPALIVVAGVEAVSEHEIVRTLHRDFISDTLVSVLRGNNRTRLLITTAPDADEIDLLQREAARLSQSVLPIKFDPNISICYDKFASSGIIEVDEARTPVRVRRLTLRLAIAVGEMIRGKAAAPNERFGLLHLRNVAIFADDQPALLTIAWDKLLTPCEQFLFGLVSASHDGLRRSVATRMLAAADKVLRAEDDSLDLGKLDIDALEKKLCGLLSKRVAKLDAGQHTSDHQVQEDLYFVDRKWRPLVLFAFFREANGRYARLAHWLVAREAAAQSSTLRMKCSVANGSGDSFGRDIQTLHALIASIDPSEASKSGCLSGDPGGKSEFLTPLECFVERPSAAATLRFCYLTLYKAEIEGDEFATDGVWDNAKLRLGLLLPLFSPETPCLPVGQRGLKGIWDHYLHLRRAFTKRELAELLTSIALAAQRLQRFDIVCAASKLAIALTKPGEGEENLEASAILRIIRAEIDIGLLIGGNPESLLVRGRRLRFSPSTAKTLFGGTAWSDLTPDNNPGRAFQTRISDVSDHLDRLLNSVFPAGGLGTPDLLKARGKLFARLGETHHLAGCNRLARESFERATAIENELRRGGTSSVSPILGGRGARAYIRLLIDIAQSRASAIAYRAACQTTNWYWLPPLGVLDQDCCELKLARQLQLINQRRLHSRKTADFIGTNIDEARIAAAARRYAYALERLDDAAQVPYHTGSSTEVLLELAAVRTRCAVECIRWLDGAGMGEVVSADALDELATYLGSSTGSRDDLRARLIHRAEANHHVLDELVKPYPPGLPYRTYANLKRAWITALSVEEKSGRSDSNRRLLFLALEYADIAIREMLEAGYRMHLAKTAHLRGRLKAALNRF